ncbi:hypothetical protein CJD38_15960 [Stenotrophobium rhamnosiphilum]|uniref:Uncharacterized protein n=1 Tax=Stenotrophobium rhamnosiphilum TaxID=2029166 RepID=A0A2T5MBV1_9GAMM|nr:hypothetical protein CJD38_15960 [Stenotrophobium rhamnosiphilum]
MTESELPLLIRSKTHVLVFSAFVFGIGMPLGFYFFFGHDLAAFFLWLVVAPAGGLIWGLAMWEVFIKDRRNRLLNLPTKSR